MSNPILSKKTRYLSLLRFPAFTVTAALGFMSFSPGLSSVGIAVAIGFLIFSLGVHEAAHAQVALWCGDPTARDLGRITANPLVHIDPFMTIILPLVLFATSDMLFGGAKPVPVIPRNLRNPLRDMCLVAIAGPLSNVILAIIFSVASTMVQITGLYTSDQMMVQILNVAVYSNVLLAAFNMVPIPPLDGSRVMMWLLPPSLRQSYHQLERFGILIVFGLIYYVPGARAILASAVGTMYGYIQIISEPMVRSLAPLFGVNL